MMRLLYLELENFKNVEHGLIKLSEIPGDGLKRAGSCVTGIYGQNGSGKTSLVDALEIIRYLWIGMELDERVADCIAQGKEALTIKLGFYIDGLIFNSNKRIAGHYAVKVARGIKTVEVIYESLSFKDTDSGEAMRSYYSFEKNDEIPRPESLWKSVLPVKGDWRARFMVAKEVAQEMGCSILFSPRLALLLPLRADNLKEQAKQKGKGSLHEKADRFFLFAEVLLLCKAFAADNLAVIPLSHHAVISLGLLNVITHGAGILPTGGASLRNNVILSLTDPRMVSDEKYETIKQTEGTINKALGALVPGLSFEARSLSEVVMDDGSPGRMVECFSHRGDTVVPFRCESEGIKKIVTILIALIDVFSDPAACVVIDELDSGVFEFLLGEILEVIAEHGKGQLIFTAHNLIPLEVLSDKSIVFTTTNPKNRYITFTGHRPTNNLRDQYLRAINLGGQAESIYEHTSKYEIDNAFYRAGKSLHDVRKSHSEDA